MDPPHGALARFQFSHVERWRRWLFYFFTCSDRWYMKIKVFEYNSIFPHKFTEAHANSHQYVCFQNDYVHSKAQKTLKKLQETPTLYFFLRHNHLMIHVILLPELSDLLCSVEHSLCLSPLSQLLLINFHALPYITSMPCGREAARFMFAFMIERTWVPVRAHTLACLEDVCVCASVCLRSILVCVSERLLFFESKGGLLFWKSPSQFLAPLWAAAVVAAAVVAAATAVAAAATAGWLSWEKSISWVNGRDSPLRGQMVVNNQGRIGKALIPCFVLFHLLEARMGWGWRGWVREQGTLGSW